MPTWLLYAILSALAASLVGIFGKLGVARIDDNLATTVRSIVMSLLLIAFAAVIGAWGKVTELKALRPMLAIVLSGAAGAASWIFYFKALKLAEVSQVAPIDKLSMPLGILLAVLFLRERPSGINWVGILLVAAGAYMATMQRHPT